MGKIVAIGGGKVDEGATRRIDERIMALTGRSRPKALFVPTASNDSEENCERFRRGYGAECDLDFLLLSKRPARDAIWRQITAADLIYVGGGNTLKMIAQWRHVGVDQMMIEAHGQGKVMCGVSAGAICWFLWGNSDSRRFRQNLDSFPLIRVTGLGLIRAAACPHFDSETARPASFRAMLGEHGGIGIALEDCTALEVADAGWRILCSRDGARAYRLQKRDGEVHTEELPARDEAAPLYELLPFT